METDGQRFYSVLVRKEVVQKMVKEIDQISEVFSLPYSDATVILIRLRWNSFQASDRLGDDKEKFLAELGLVRVSDPSQENESISCFARHETHGDDNNLVSTPFCSHKYCKTCWRDYLTEFLEKKNKNEEERVVQVVCCPTPDCAAPVGPDTIEKIAEPVKKMYESYVLGSFMEGKKESIKWCPAQDCGYAIERREDLTEDDESLDFGVVCLCGHTFCWSCQLESHRPVTCNNASLWQNVLDQASSNAWIAQNTKRCPRCYSPVQRDDDSELRLVTCLCSCTFCWRCFRSGEEHNGEWNCVEVFVPPSSKKQENANSSDSEHTQTHYVSLWEAGHKALEEADSQLKAIERHGIAKLTENFGWSDQDARAMREGWMLIVQCRLVLKWSCVFEYFITDYQSAKKQYVKHLRDEATKTLVRHKATLEKLMNEALSSGDFSCFELKLSATTTNTGNYFHGFVKTLEGGLPEVKVDSAPISYWFCDRCTFQNSLSDQQCKMCFVPLDSPFGNNNTASAHHQVPDNPFARQGNIKP